MENLLVITVVYGLGLCIIFYVMYITHKNNKDLKLDKSILMKKLKFKERNNNELKRANIYLKNKNESNDSDKEKLKKRIMDIITQRNILEASNNKATREIKSQKETIKELEHRNNAQFLEMKKQEGIITLMKPQVEKSTTYGKPNLPSISFEKNKDGYIVPKVINDRRPIPIEKYDEKGNLMDLFKSLRDAEKQTGISRHKIRKSCEDNGGIVFGTKVHFKYSVLE